MVARGERPGYRVQSRDGGWTIDALPWLSIDANDRRSAVKSTRAAVAAWLGASPDAFDMESD